MEKSKKVLILTTAYDPFIGGSEIAIREIIKRLSAWFFDILTPKLKRGLPDLEERGNYRIHRIGWGSKMDKLLFPFLGFDYADKLIGENEYHLIHAFQASHAAGAAWRLKLSGSRLPLVVTLQEGKNLDKQKIWLRLARKIILSRADSITAISEYLKQYAKKTRKNLPAIVIPNGVDIENFSREFSYGELSDLKDKLGIKPGEKVVTSVSRLVSKNGIADLIKAFKILADKLTSLQACKLILVGGGPEKDDLEKLAVELGIRSKIIFAGDVGHDELPKFLKISDVFVRPSLSEGLGSAFLEAMAAGVPIIGTKVGGIPDFLKDRKTGLFCLPGNPESIAEKIRFLLSNPDLRQKITVNAMELVKEKYDWQKIATEYEKIYNEFQ